MQFLKCLPPTTQPGSSATALAKKFAVGIALSLSAACAIQNPTAETPPPVSSVAQILFSDEVTRMEKKAPAYLSAVPLTVTAFTSERSAGGPHDFYSEGDYWWPNPEDPEGPYIRRDGMTNPANFIAHRQALMRFSDIVATLTSSYLMNGDQRYADAAIKHLRAWLVAPETRMNPNLAYAQAIKGRSTGRSIGVIDTIHLTEVARSVKLLSAYGEIPPEDDQAIKGWFSSYLTWLKTSPFGLKERQHPNNHGVCWAMQAAAFADLVGDEALLEAIRADFKAKFVGEMMAADGSFPAELARTKPYGYSLFVLDAMATLAQIASTEEDDLWQYQSEDGRGMAKAVQYMLPYIVDKSRWPLEPDVLYWDQWPVRQPALVFAALAFNNKDYLQVWRPLEADPKEYEVLRNLPVRHPLLWLKTSMPKAAELEETEPVASAVATSVAAHP